MALAMVQAAAVDVAGGGAADVVDAADAATETMRAAAALSAAWEAVAESW